MSYIITAIARKDTEMNHGADKEKVEASVLAESDHEITFDIRGEFGRQAELTLKLCKTMIDAGYVEFDIGHSY